MISKHLLVSSFLGLMAAAGLACSRGPHTVETLNKSANRSYATGDYASALETYRRAEVLRPDLPSLNYNAGNALSQQSDFQRAITEQQKAAQSTDADVQDRAYYSIGNAYVRANQLREAADAYKSALRANPSDVDAKYNLEVIQRRLDQQEARRQQAGDQQDDQSGQGQQGQNTQAGQGEQTNQGQSGAEAQGQPGAGGQQASASAGGAPGGYTGTPAGQAAALNPDLKKALEQFNKTGNIEDALRALDIVGQQERLRDASRGGGAPQPQGRDW